MVVVEEEASLSLLASRRRRRGWNPTHPPSLRCTALSAPVIDTHNICTLSSSCIFKCRYSEVSIYGRHQKEPHCTIAGMSRSRRQRKRC